MECSGKTTQSNMYCFHKNKVQCTLRQTKLIKYQFFLSYDEELLHGTKDKCNILMIVVIQKYSPECSMKRSFHIKRKFLSGSLFFSYFVPLNTVVAKYYFKNENVV